MEPMQGGIEMDGTSSNVSHPSIAIGVASTSASSLLTRVMIELSQTEQTYVAAMQALLDDFIMPLATNEKIAAALDITAHAVQVFQRTWGALTPIVKLHQEVGGDFRGIVDACPALSADDIVSRVAAVFLKHAHYLKLYTAFVDTHCACIGLLSNLSLLTGEKKRWTKWIEDQSRAGTAGGNGQSFQSLLIMPIQRIPRYELLLNKMEEVFHDEVNSDATASSAVDSRSSSSSSSSLSLLSSARLSIHSLNMRLNEWQRCAEAKQKLWMLSEEVRELPKGYNILESHRKYTSDAVVALLFPNPSARKLLHLWLTTDVLLLVSEESRKAKGWIEIGDIVQVTNHALPMETQPKYLDFTSNPERCLSIEAYSGSSAAAAWGRGASKTFTPQATKTLGKRLSATFSFSASNSNSTSNSGAATPTSSPAPSPSHHATTAVCNTPGGSPASSPSATPSPLPTATVCLEFSSASEKDRWVAWLQSAQESLTFASLQRARSPVPRAIPATSSAVTAGATTHATVSGHKHPPGSVEEPRPKRQRKSLEQEQEQEREQQREEEKAEQVPASDETTEADPICLPEAPVMESAAAAASESEFTMEASSVAAASSSEGEEEAEAQMDLDSDEPLLPSELDLAGLEHDRSLSGIAEESDGDLSHSEIGGGGSRLSKTNSSDSGFFSAAEVSASEVELCLPRTPADQARRDSTPAEEQAKEHEQDQPQPIAIVLDEDSAPRETTDQEPVAEPAVENVDVPLTAPTEAVAAPSSSGPMELDEEEHVPASLVANEDSPQEEQLLAAGSPVVESAEETSSSAIPQLDLALETVKEAEVSAQVNSEPAPTSSPSNSPSTHRKSTLFASRRASTLSTSRSLGSLTSRRRASTLPSPRVPLVSPSSSLPVAVPIVLPSAGAGSGKGYLAPTVASAARQAATRNQASKADRSAKATTGSVTARNRPATATAARASPPPVKRMADMEPVLAPLLAPVATPSVHLPSVQSNSHVLSPRLVQIAAAPAATATKPASKYVSEQRTQPLTDANALVGKENA